LHLSFQTDYSWYQLSIRTFAFPTHPCSVASSTVVNQTENIVEDEVAALSIWKELEGLGIVHGLLLLIDLQDMLDDGPW
jgi:hypothetical protein